VPGEEVTRQGGGSSHSFWQIALINDNTKEGLSLDDIRCFTGEAVRLSRFFYSRGNELMDLVLDSDEVHQSDT
jgi:hypothetical protein